MNFYNRLLISSALLSTLCISNVQAMENLTDPEQAVGRHRQPQPTVVSEINSSFASNMQGKASAFYRLAKEAYNGEFESLVGETLEFFLATYAGQTKANFAKKSNKEFDQETVNAVTTKLTDKFFTFLKGVLTKRADIYGIVDETGQRVSIYNNKTVFELLADAIVPEGVPCRDFIIKALNNQTIESFIRNRVTEVLSEFVVDLFKSRGLTIKETVSKKIVESVKSKPQSEVSLPQMASVVNDNNVNDNNAKSQPSQVVQPVAEKMPSVVRLLSSPKLIKQEDEENSIIMDFLKPRLTHYLRTFLSEELKLIKNEVLRSTRNQARPVVQTIAGSLASGATYCTGMAVEHIGGSLPYVGAPLRMLGSLIQSTPVCLSAGAVGYTYGNEAFEVGVNQRANSKADELIDGFLLKMLGYSREEHVLYHLNPAPSELERAFYSQDYDYLNQITARGLSLRLLRAVALNPASRFYEFLQEGVKRVFSSTPEITDEQVLRELKPGDSDVVKPLHLADQEKAYRQLLQLTKKNSEEAALIWERLNKFPSHKVLQNGQTSPVKGQYDYKSEEAKTLIQLDNIEKGIVALLSELPNDLPYNFQLEKTLMGLMLDRSVDEQDRFAKWSLKKKEELKAITDTLDTNNPQQFVDELCNRLIQADENEYIQTNKVALDNLEAISLCDGWSYAERIMLLKKLQRNRMDSVVPVVNLNADYETVWEHEISLLQNYYNELVGVQTGVCLSKLYQATLRKMGHLETIRESLSKNEKFINGTNEERTELVERELAKQGKGVNDLFKSYRLINRPFQKSLDETFIGKRIELVSELVTDIEKRIQQKDDADFDKDFVIVDKDSKLMTLTELKEAVDAKLEVLSCYNKDKPHLFEMAELLNGMKLRNLFGSKRLCNLEVEDMVLAHRERFSRKLEDACAEDRAFAKKYQAEIALLQETPYYSSRVFYGLKEAVRDMKIRNRAILESLFAKNL